MPLTPEQIKLVKSSAPALKEHGLAITKTMYEHMLGENPELFTIFSKSNMESGQQPRALATSLLAYASHIDDLGALSPAVERITHKHASLYLRPEQYGVVAKYLMAALQEVLGEALTPELAEAWGAAYWQLANIFINREKELYAQGAASGWTDWRDFRIAKKVPESDEITSFYLEPVDPAHKPLPKFLPGQYISIRTHVPAINSVQPRQYSLSDAPWGDYYRISVKREQGNAPDHPGAVSNIMHDTKHEGDVLQVSHPYGDFFLSSPNDTTDSTTSTNTHENTDTSEGPIVFMSGGVGLTCLTSILNSLVASHSNRPISWLHVARRSSSRAFRQHIDNITSARQNVHSVFFNTKPSETDKKGEDYDFLGRMSTRVLDKDWDLFLSDPRTQYFVCGPEGFMKDMDTELQELGVQKERVHMELYGTGGIERNT